MAANLLDRMDDAHRRIEAVSVGINRSRGFYVLIVHLCGSVPPVWLRSLEVALEHDDGPATYRCHARWTLITPTRAEAELEQAHSCVLPPFPGGREEAFTPFRAVRLERRPDRGWHFPNETSLRHILVSLDAPVARPSVRAR